MKRSILVLILIFAVSLFITAQDELDMLGLGMEDDSAMTDPALDAELGLGADPMADPMAGDPMADPMAGDPMAGDPLGGIGDPSVLLPEDALADQKKQDAKTDDPLAGDPLAGGGDPLLDSDPFAGGGDPFAGGDPFGSDPMAATGPTIGVEAAAGPMPDDAPPLVDPKPIKKKRYIPTLLTSTLTDDIYSKNGDLKGYRNLKEVVNCHVKSSSKFGSLNTVSNIYDDTLQTAWVSKKSKEGVNEYILFDFKEIDFAPVYENFRKTVTVKRLKILNGHCKSKDKWEKHYRVRKLNIYKNNRLLYRIKLHDTMNWQTVTLPRAITLRAGDKIKAKITGLFPQFRYFETSQVAISEIAFIGK